MQITISKKTLFICVGLLLSLILVFGVYFFVSNKNDKKVTSVLSAENSSSAMYLPKDLPVGYVIDKQSIGKANGVSTYTISSSSAEKIFVSIQAKPETSVLNKFHTEQLGLPETIITPYGDVVIGQVRGRYTASIVIDNNWVIVTAPLDTNYEDFQAIVSSFEKN